jgi:hypothetical protein
VTTLGPREGLTGIDVTGDGDPEGLFTVLSGGSQGDFAFGVVKGFPSDGAGDVIGYGERPGVAISRRSATSFEIGFPRLKRGDADCSPSAYRIWRCRFREPTFKHASPSTVRRLPSRFRGG